MFIDNIAGSIGTAAAGITPSTAANPADGLFASGFLIPQLLNFKREYDGGPYTSNPNIEAPSAGNPTGNLAYQRQQAVKTNLGTGFSPDGSSGSTAQTIGTNAFYGQLGAVSGSGNDAINTAIRITARNAAGTSLANGIGEDGNVLSDTNLNAANLPTKGNYLFGNFNQNGRRDYASVKEAVNAALSLSKVDAAVGGQNGIFVSDGGIANNVNISSISAAPGAGSWAAWDSATPVGIGSGQLPQYDPARNKAAATKGDLIVLGDFNSDGRFNGKDLYLLARGASLSDNASTDGLATAPGVSFSDAVRNPNAKLNKNAALTYISTQLAANGADPADIAAAKSFLRSSSQTALQLTNDPTGANAFNKFDVNRDGFVNRQDAGIVDAFVGKDYRNLDDTLSAVVATDVNSAGTRFLGNPLTDQVTPRKQISLVEVELNDTGDITHVVDGFGDSDFKQVRLSLGTGLLDGDTDFNGSVGFGDLGIVLSRYGTVGNKWSLGDFNFDGLVGFGDLGALLANYGGASPSALTISTFQFPELDSQAISLLSENGFNVVVPEPAGVGLLASALSLTLRRRQRRA